MQDSRQLIGITIAPLMKASGYRKQRLTWHKRTEDTILVYSAQKSSWGGDLYYFHSGIYLRSLGDEITPPYYRCHIQANLEELVPNKFECRQVCDFEYPVFELSERLIKLAEYTSQIMVPWLDTHSSLEALHRAAEADYFDQMWPRVRSPENIRYYLKEVIRDRFSPFPRPVAKP